MCHTYIESYMCKYATEICDKSRLILYSLDKVKYFSLFRFNLDDWTVTVEYFDCRLYFSKIIKCLKHLSSRVMNLFILNECFQN